ncbi:MAG: excinuclease ABC subunit UvrA, partial [Deltaproteobacteria bacterium]|nr:excinuclease ABC subunit UvrA [Deltaproteobacteria bacterium]
VRSVLVRSPRQRTLIGAVLQSLGLDDRTPVSGWTERQRDVLLEGSRQTFDLSWSQQWGRTHREVQEERPWPGLLDILEGWNSRLDWLTAERECPRCRGGRLREALLAVTIGGLGVHAFTRLCVDEALATVGEWRLEGEKAAIAERPLLELRRRLSFLQDVGLGYLELDRSAQSLSGGEAQRIRLASQLGGGLTGVIYVLDEPTIGLHARDTDRLLTTLEGLRDLGNSVVVVEHDPDSILRADHVIDLGPGAGRHGGQVVASGTPEELIANPDSVTGRWLSGLESIPRPMERRRPRAWVTLRSPTGNNLKGEDARIPTGVWVGVSGVSGSGKSTLIMDTLAPALLAHLGREVAARPHRGLDLGEEVARVVLVDQAPIGRTPRSTAATYCGVMDKLRALFAQTTGAQTRGWKPGRFSFNSADGRCGQCQGRGAILVEMHFLPDVWVTCSSCRGKRYDRDTLAVRWRGHSIADVLAMRVDDALALFANHRSLKRPLQALADVGLGYVALGQPATTLSGGEAQRVKLAAELTSRRGHCVYILDEPTTGLHLADVARLVEVLHRLVDAGHTVITIEHHLDVLGQADWILDLGPEGGAEGGRIVAEGPPEAIEAAGTATGARNLIPLGVCAVLGTGCLASNNGVWSFFIYQGAEPEVTTTVEHNYLGSVRPEDGVGGDWTNTEESDLSPGVVFGQIFHVAGEDAKILVLEDRVFFGNRTAGMWEFTWTNSEVETEIHDHNSGYTFSRESTAELVTVIELDFFGGNSQAEGTVRRTVRQVNAYEESDTWDAASVGRYSGETPSGYYLDDSSGEALWNIHDTTECSGNPCTLSVDVSGVFANPIEARNTGIHADDFDGVDSAGQPGGVDLGT